MLNGGRPAFGLKTGRLAGSKVGHLTEESAVPKLKVNALPAPDGEVAAADDGGVMRSAVLVFAFVFVFVLVFGSGSFSFSFSFSGEAGLASFSSVLAFGVKSNVKGLATTGAPVSLGKDRLGSSACLVSVLPPLRKLKANGVLAPVPEVSEEDSSGGNEVGAFSGSRGFVPLLTALMILQMSTD